MDNAPSMLGTNYDKMLLNGNLCFFTDTGDKNIIQNRKYVADKGGER